eukprot:scaffold12636_cov117-Skeletonema_marinoi.AAC.1
MPLTLGLRDFDAATYAHSIGTMYNARSLMNAPSRQSKKKKLGNSNQQNEIKETSDERKVEGGMKRDLWSANDGYLKECMAGE